MRTDVAAGRWIGCCGAKSAACAALAAARRSQGSPRIPDRQSVRTWFDRNPPMAMRSRGGWAGCDSNGNGAQIRGRETLIIGGLGADEGCFAGKGCLREGPVGKRESLTWHYAKERKGVPVRRGPDCSQTADYEQIEALQAHLHGSEGRLRRCVPGAIGAASAPRSCATGAGGLAPMLQPWFRHRSLGADAAALAPMTQPWVDAAAVAPGCGALPTLREGRTAHPEGRFELVLRRDVLHANAQLCAMMCSFIPLVRVQSKRKARCQDI